MLNIPVSELAEAMPMMTDRQYDDLVASIRTRGFDPKHAIVLWRGQILDGRHRARACERLGIDPPTTEFVGNEAEAAAEVWQENVARRHFPDAHRAVLAAKLVTVRLGDNQYSPDRADPSRVTREMAAEFAGVSTRSLDRATELLRMDDPAALSEVTSGKIGLQTALRTARTRRKAAASQPAEPPAPLDPPAFPASALQPLRSLAAANSAGSALVIEIDASQQRPAAQILGAERLAPTVHLRSSHDGEDAVDVVLAAAGGPADDHASQQWTRSWDRLAPGGAVLVCSADRITPEGHQRVTTTHLGVLTALGGTIGMIWPVRGTDVGQPASTVIEIRKPA